MLPNHKLRYPWPMQKFKVSIQATLYDQHGKLIRKFRPRAAHSFLAQFIEMLHAQMAQASTNITNTSGSEESLGPQSTILRANSPASNLDYGILIGNGTTLVDIDDYVLESPISADITASDHTFGLTYPIAGTRRLSISRTFTNTIASPIPIEEVGLITFIVAIGYFTIDRTLYSIAIPASSSLELTYRIDVSV